MFSNCLEIGSNLREKYKDFFALADESIELCDIIMKNLDDLKLKDSYMSKYQAILGFNLYKGSNSFLSVMNLSNKGFIEDAKTISRKIIEMAVNLKYLSIDVEKRENQYWHYPMLSNYKILEEVEKENKEKTTANRIYTDWLKNELEKYAPEIQTGYEKSKTYYELNGKGKVKDNFLRNWSGKSMRKMAIECNHTDEVIPYKLFSIATHASVEDIKKYYNVDKPCFSLDLSIDDVPIVILETLRMYLVLVELVIHEFKLELTDSLNLVKKHLEVREHAIFRE